jgi:hypothetical protein
VTEYEPVAMPRTNAEREAIWNEATGLEHPVTPERRSLLFSALHAADIAYLCGYLPLGYVPAPETEASP